MNFNQIPDNRLVPFVYVEFDNTRAVEGPGVMPYKGLLIGQRLSTGSVAAEIPKRISNYHQAEDYWGRGSQIAGMARAWFEANEQTELWGCALDDDNAGVKASGSFAFSGQATEAGVVYGMLGGKRIKVAVESGDTASEIAAAFQAELASDDNGHLPVSSHAVTDTVHVYLKNKGAFGNEYDLRLNYYEGEALPAGVSCTVSQPSSGAANPDIQDALDAIGAQQFHIIAHPYTDDSNMDALEEELTDRWGPLTQNDGVAFACKNAAYATLGTYADSRNSQFSVVMGGYKVPTAPWEVASSLAGVVAYYAQVDRGRPFQTLSLPGVLAPAVSDRFTAAERNLLLLDGIATFYVGAGDKMQIERLVTTYKENSLGAPDSSYRDLNTVLILSYLRWDFRNYILRKFPRSKLANDGTRFAPGQAIVTPSIMKAEAILKFTEWERIGLVENFADFKANLLVERNESDPNRLDVLLPPNLINQLIVTAAQIQFRV